MSPLVVRPARPDDHPVVAALFLTLDTGDPPMAATRFANELCATTWVATKGDVIVAYLFAQFMKDTVYVRHVATALDARRTGAARALFAIVEAEARARGAVKICLNVKPDNVAAVRLYESRGMRYRYTSQSHRFAWSALATHEVAGLTSRIAEPEADAAIEARFGLPAGQLATTRALPNKRIVGLFRGDEPVGFACFDPTFPGAFPFRATSATEVPALLEACRTHATQDTMNVVIEDAPALSEWLTNAGAPPRMSFAFFAGDL